MNVFHRFTRESLIRNRSRTLVTIVGLKAARRAPQFSKR